MSSLPDFLDKAIRPFFKCKKISVSGCGHVQTLSFAKMSFICMQMEKKIFTSVKGFTLILRNGQFFICTTRVFPPIVILLLMFEISSGIITKTFPMTLPLGRYVYLEWSKSGFISDRRSHGSWFMKGNDTSLPRWS